MSSKGLDAEQHAAVGGMSWSRRFEGASPRREIVNVLGRVHSSSAWRRVVPMPATLPALRAYAAWSRRKRSHHFERMRWFYGELLRHTALAGSEADVAERAIVEQLRTLEFHWRPWLMRAGEADGLEHYFAARAAGRPIVIPFVHYGIPYAQFPTLPRLGIDAWVIAAAHHYDESREGYSGRVAAQGRAYVSMLGERRAILRPGAFAKAQKVLNEGGALSIAFDLEGTLPTPFLGRTVGLAGGPARLAMTSEALVVPLVVRRRRNHPLLTFAPALDSRVHGDEAALQRAIAVVMEGWALERPECVLPLTDQPNGPPLIRDFVTTEG